MLSSILSWVSFILKLFSNVCLFPIIIDVISSIITYLFASCVPLYLRCPKPKYELTTEFKTNFTINLPRPLSKEFVRASCCLCCTLSLSLSLPLSHC